MRHKMRPVKWLVSASRLFETEVEQGNSDANPSIWRLKPQKFLSALFRGDMQTPHEGYAL